MKRLWMVLLVLAGVATGVGLYWWYLTTPVYALSQVNASIKGHDWDTFTIFVDVDSLADTTATDFAAIAAEAMEEKRLSRIITKGLSALLAIKVRTSLRDDLKGWVTGAPPERKGALSSFLPTPSESKTSLKKISWKGAVAKARVGIGNDAVLELELEKAGENWRVTRILNVRELYEKSKKK